MEDSPYTLTHKSQNARSLPSWRWPILAMVGGFLVAIGLRIESWPGLVASLLPWW